MNTGSKIRILNTSFSYMRAVQGPNDKPVRGIGWPVQFSAPIRDLIGGLGDFFKVPGILQISCNTELVDHQGPGLNHMLDLVIITP